jgi:hypothetical protein
MKRELQDSQIIELAAELNSILWTPDSPRLDSRLAPAFRGVDEIQLIGGNMQCTAHSYVCAGIFLRRGEGVTTRSGSALIVYPEQSRTDRPHFIVKHWWITTPSGLCDLSLNLKGLSQHKPVVFENRNVADSKWRVVFKHDFQSLLNSADESQAENVSGVFYQTDNKMDLTLDEAESELCKYFEPASAKGIPLRYLDIVIHCEALLAGGASLRGIAQPEVWQRLSKGT